MALLALALGLAAAGCGTGDIKSFDKEIQRAQAALLAKDVEGAMRAADRAVATAPEFGPAYVVRGLVWQADGRHDRAVADFTAAIDKGLAESPAGYFLRAESLAAMGDHAGAVADYDVVLARNSGFWPAQAGRGVSLAALGEDERALLDLDRALAVKRGVVTEVVGRGATHVQYLRTQKQAPWTVTLRLPPEPLVAPAFAARGELRAARGGRRAAFADFDAALAADPTLAVARRGRAKLHFADGECVFGAMDLVALSPGGGQSAALAAALHRHLIAGTPCADHAF